MPLQGAKRQSNLLLQNVTQNLNLLGCRDKIQEEYFYEDAKDFNPGEK